MSHFFGVFVAAFLFEAASLDPNALRQQLETQDELSQSTPQSSLGMTPSNAIGPLPPPPPAPLAQSLGQQISLAEQQQEQGQEQGQAQGEGEDQQADQPAPNPTLQLYRMRTLQYEKDATEAAKAATMYAQMTKQLVDSGTIKATTKSLASAEMARIGVPLWGHATWEVEKMLTNPAPGKAAKAFAGAAAPYMKLAGEYGAAQNAYNAAAGGYSFRVTLDRDAAKKLQNSANQMRLEGNNGEADKYQADAASLMGQAETFAGLARSYQSTSVKMHQARMSIGGMAVQAGAFAGYFKDPLNSMGPMHVFPFTVVPPLEFAQTGVTHHSDNKGKHLPPPEPKTSSGNFLSRLR